MPLNQRGRQLPRSVIGRVGPGVAQLGVSRRGRRFVVCASRSVWCKKTPDGGFVSCSSVASHLPARIPTAGSVGAMGSVVLPASGRCGPTSVIRASRPAAVVWRPIKKSGFPWAGVKVRGVQKISLISCARLLVATGPPGTRRALLMAADPAPRRARSMRARGSEISTA